MHLVGFTAVEIGRNVQTGRNGDARTRRRAVSNTRVSLPSKTNSFPH
jgi:hypothetical protein